MIVKMFPGGGNAKNSADYLVGKKHDRELAKEVKGDIRLTQAIAEQANFSQQVTVGCLSFEEPDLPENQKEEIIERFEKTFFAGLEKEDYSISWVEHTDKGRLELNFYIANVELQTEKRLKPYFHKADFHLKDSFQDVINHEYNLSSPKDPEKAQPLRLDKTLDKTAKEIQTLVHEYLVNELENGNINSRDDIIQILDEAYGIERVTPQAISFKNPNGGRNIRLRGNFYSEQFFKENETGTTRIIGESEREENSTRTTAIERDYRESLERYQKAVGIRAERNFNDYKRNRTTIQELDFGTNEGERESLKGIDSTATKSNAERNYTSEERQPNIATDRERKLEADTQELAEKGDQLRSIVRDSIYGNSIDHNDNNNIFIEDQRNIITEKPDQHIREQYPKSENNILRKPAETRRAEQDDRIYGNYGKSDKEIGSSAIHRERQFDYLHTKREQQYDNQRGREDNSNHHEVTATRGTEINELQRETINTLEERNKRIEQNKQQSARVREQIERVKQAIAMVTERIQAIGGKLQSLFRYDQRNADNQRKFDDRKHPNFRNKQDYERRNRTNISGKEFIKNSELKITETERQIEPRESRINQQKHAIKRASEAINELINGTQKDIRIWETTIKQSEQSIAEIEQQQLANMKIEINAPKINDREQKEKESSWDMDR